MKINVTAKPMARADQVERISDTEYKVSVKEPPIEGRANRAITKVLAEYFGVSASQVSLISGYASRNKVFNIE